MLLFHSFARSPDSGNRDNSYQSCLFMSNSYFYLMKAMKNFKMSYNYSKHSEKKKKNSIHEAACYPVIRILPFLDHFVTNHTTKKKKKKKFYLLGGIIHHYSYGIKIQLYLFRFAQFSSC